MMNYPLGFMVPSPYYYKATLGLWLSRFAGQFDFCCQGQQLELQRQGANELIFTLQSTGKQYTETYR